FFALGFLALFFAFGLLALFFALGFLALLFTRCPFASGIAFRSGLGLVLRLLAGRELALLRSAGRGSAGGLPGGRFLLDGGLLGGGPLGSGLLFDGGLLLGRGFLLGTRRPSRLSTGGGLWCLGF